jgi:hypothetical protein
MQASRGGFVRLGPSLVFLCVRSPSEASVVRCSTTFAYGMYPLSSGRSSSFSSSQRSISKSVLLSSRAISTGVYSPAGPGQQQTQCQQSVSTDTNSKRKQALMRETFRHSQQRRCLSTAASNTTSGSSRNHAGLGTPRTLGPARCPKSDSGGS